MSSHDGSAPNRVEDTIAGSGVEELKPKIIHICAKLVDQWKNIDHSKIKVRQFTGGVTNILFRATVYEAENDEQEKLHVMVRIYGEGTEKLIDRKIEIETMQCLYQKGRGPKVYGIFENGFVYGYFPGAPLSAQDLQGGRDNVQIARKIAEWHQMDIPTLDKTVKMWDCIEQWLKEAPTTFNDEQQNKLIHEIDVERLKQELPILKKELSAVNSPVVFCHNDLQPLNLIKDTTTGEINFIDYEYLNYNHRAFDVANHFLEYSGLDQLDYTKFPSREQQMEFYKVYLATFHRKKIEDISTDELESMFVEVNKFVLASHFFWGSWALIQSAVSSIDWNYLQYGLKRFTEYWANRDRLFNLQK